MKRLSVVVLLVLALLCGCFACGRTSAPPETVSKELKIGVLLPDKAGAANFSYYHLTGLNQAAESLKIAEPVCKYDVTDVSFDASAPVTATSAAPTETTLPPEPESYTNEDGNVIIRGVPVAEPEHESAVSAAADLIEGGCNVIVAADPIYDELTAFLAQQFGDVTFLQYRGTHTDVPNLQSFSDNAYEAFYLAGVVAGCEGVPQIGFTARKGSRDEKDCINAFALGAAKINAVAKVKVRMTHVDLDLGQERTLPLALIKEDACGLLAQSVFSALPVSVASGKDGGYDHDPIPCIGYGYDMQSDGGSRYLCSVVYDFSVYYADALKALADGSFDAAPYTGGVREGIVGLSELQNASELAQTTVTKLTEEFRNDTLHPLDGFEPAPNGYAANVTVK